MENEEYFKALGVVVKNKNLEKALKIFKKKVKESKLLLMINECSRYEKPSVKKRNKKHRALIKMKKNQEKNN